MLSATLKDIQYYCATYMLDYHNELFFILSSVVGGIMGHRISHDDVLKKKIKKIHPNREPPPFLKSFKHRSQTST